MKRNISLVLVLSSTLALGACAGTAGTPAAPAAQAGATTNLKPTEAVGDIAVNEEARTLLPASIRDGGVLKIGGETALPPYLYTEGDKIVGLEADFMVALGKTLGLAPHVENTKFASMVTGLTSNRIDVAMSDFSDTLERQKQVSFVDYTRAGQVLLVQAGNPKGIKTLTDLCGKSTGGPSGSLSVKIAQEQSDKCVAEGKEPVRVDQFPSGSDASLALQNKRLDSVAFDVALAKQLQKEQPDKVEAVGDLFGLGYHGAAVRISDVELQNALKAALEGLKKDGTYDRILKKWDLESMSMDTVEINATKS